MRFIWLPVLCSLLAGCISHRLRPVATVRDLAAERLACPREEVEVAATGQSPYFQLVQRDLYEARGCGRVLYVACDPERMVDGQCSTDALPYRSPRPDEPHAVVKVRGVYHSEGSAWATGLLEMVQISDGGVMARRVAVPRSTAVSVPVRPGRATWRYAAVPYWIQTTWHNVHYSRDEWRDVDFDGDSDRVTVSGTRVESRQHLETEGQCVTDFELDPQPGGVYRVQYDFYAVDRCVVSCLREVTMPDGSTSAVACEGFQVQFAEVG